MGAGPAIRRRRSPFDPEPHRAALSAIVAEVARRIAAGATPPLSNADLTDVLRRHPRGGHGFFSRTQIIAGYRAFGGEVAPELPPGVFLEYLLMRPVRTRSGVCPVTVLTRPFPCPGRCVFCPNDVRMPKSYLSDEPGCQRAEDNGFDPYLQTYNRLDAFRAMGHATDKVELLVLGGTWSFYPEAYQVWFITRCYDAMNEFARGLDRRGAAEADRVTLEGLPRAVDGRVEGTSYNRIVKRHLARHGGVPHGVAAWERLAQAQHDNEAVNSRCVGLVLETRPDHVDAAEVSRLRRLGCTKVQLGVQSMSDELLTLNQRGHDVEQAREAMGRLRGAGFKVLVHWMPNLLGATPDADRADVARLFSDPHMRPDELKVYPCSLIESAELMRFFEAGQWAPYDDAELLEVVCAAMATAPRYCRISRVIRDISAHDIVRGSRQSNLREVAARTLAARGVRCQDIRARELGGRAIGERRPELVVTAYGTAASRELFLELCLDGDALVAFARLSLPGDVPQPAEVQGRALLRELHVYGPALSLGEAAGGRAQHRGYGRQLVAAAAERAREAGFAFLSVISASGTRPYYRGLGFEDGARYQHLKLQ